MIENFLESTSTNWQKMLPSLLVKAQTELSENFCKVNFDKNFVHGLPDSLEYGIYLFRIKRKEGFCPIEFQKQWKSTQLPRKVPSISLKRFEKRNDVDKGFYFYIGKSEKLTSRIKEHCFLKTDSSTYSLKLKYQKYLLQFVDVYVSYFEITNKNIDDLDKPIIQFIITNLEKELRERYNPWVGKQ